MVWTCLEISCSGQFPYYDNLYICNDQYMALLPKNQGSNEILNDEYLIALAVIFQTIRFFTMAAFLVQAFKICGTFALCWNSYK